jgi:PAB1-binding protein PBP1
LRQAVNLSSNDSTPKSSLIINAKDLLEVEATDVVLDPASTSSSSSNSAAAKANQDSFRTDTDISGLPPPSRPRERDLQAWSAGAEGWGAGGIEDSASNGIGGLSLDDDFSKSTNGKQRGGAAAGGGGGAWDQFAANERMYGLKTDYNEEIYTTKLDRNTKDFKDREARAAQLEREILKVSNSP